MLPHAVQACCTIAHVVQLLPSCIPQRYILPHAIQLLILLWVAACHTVASCCVAVAIANATYSVVYYRMLYSCCHCACHNIMCCCMPYSCFRLYSHCHCVCHSVVLSHVVQLLHVHFPPAPPPSGTVLQ